MIQVSSPAHGGPDSRRESGWRSRHRPRRDPAGRRTGPVCM